MQEYHALCNFFNTVLPAKSQVNEFYHLWLLNEGNIASSTIEGLAELALTRFSDRDCYFSICTSQDVHKRNSSNLLYSKVIVLDIDIKGKIHHSNADNYDSNEQINIAVVNFCKQSGYVPTYIVNSGSGGLHLYFVLKDKVSAVVREQLQKAFYLLAKEKYNLHADPNANKITQVFRVPFTLHSKTLTKVTVLNKLENKIIDSVELFKALSTYYPHIFATKKVDVNIVPSQDGEVTLATDFEFGFNCPTELYPAEEAYNVSCRCRQIAYLADSDYHNWFQALAILGHFKDGYYLAKGLSAQAKIKHFSEHDFDIQWSLLVLGRPPKCSSFKTNNPSLCADCPYTYIVSPISLHSSKDKAIIPELLAFYKTIFPDFKEEDDVVDVTRVDNLNIKGPLDFRPWSFGTIPASFGLNSYYKTQSNPSETYIEKIKKDKTGNIVEIIRETLYNAIIEFMYYEENIDIDKKKETIYHFLVNRNDGAQFKLSTCLPLNTVRASELFAANGIIVGTAGMNVVNTYLSSYVTEVMGNRAAANMPAEDHYGWVTYNKEHGFVTDNGVITKDKLIPVSLRGYIAQDQYKRFYASGMFDEWQNAMKVYYDTQQYLCQLIICASFASPLLIHTIPDIRCAFINLYGASGIGKSSILRAALSVWGNPLNLSISGSSIALQKLMSLTRNLPVCVEEVLQNFGKDIDGLGSFVFQMIGGTEKTKLTQKSEIKDRGEWSCVFLGAANEPLKEALLSYTNSHNAAQMRIIDIDYVTKQYQVDSIGYAAIKEAEHKYMTNFGIAGPLFIQWCLQNWHEVTGLRTRIDGLITKYNKPSDQRYITYPMALFVLTCDLLNRSGILKWDYRELERYVFDDTYNKLDEELKEVSCNPIDQLSMFIAEQTTNNALAVRTDKLTDNEKELLKRGMPIPNYILTPYISQTINIRWVLDTNTLYIRIDAFKRWLKDKGYRFLSFRNYFKKKNWFNTKTINLLNGVSYAAQFEQECLYFSKTDLEELGLLSKVDNLGDESEKKFYPQPVPDGIVVPPGEVFIGYSAINKPEFRPMTAAESRLYRALILKQTND